MNRRVLMILLAIVTIVCLVPMLCLMFAPKRAALPYAKIGEKVTAGDLTVTVNSIEVIPDGAASKGAIFVGLKLTIVNNGSKEAELNRVNMLKILDKDNVRFGSPTSRGFMKVKSGPELPSSIPPGKEISGMAGYEVPDNATNLRLIVIDEVGSNIPDIFLGESAQAMLKKSEEMAAVAKETAQVIAAQTAAAEGTAKAIAAKTVSAQRTATAVVVKTATAEAIVKKETAKVIATETAIVKGTAQAIALETVSAKKTAEAAANEEIITAMKDVCRNLSKYPVVKRAASGPIGFINILSIDSYEPDYSVLTPSLQGVAPMSTIQTLACFFVTRTTVETCEYTDNVTQRRVKIDQEVYLIDLVKKEEVAQGYFYGDSPEPCPLQVKADINEQLPPLVGSMVTDEEIFKWVGENWSFK